MNKGIIFYTDNRLWPPIAAAVQTQLKKVAREKMIPIVSTSLKPLAMGMNIVFDLERGHLTMFKQILGALEASESDIIFFCEHDVLYHPSHFDFTPPKDKFYYNQNWWKIRKDGFAVHWDADQVSGLCAHRQTAIKWYKERIATFDYDKFDRKFEPMSGAGSESWKSEYPNIDIRHDKNLTYNKWSLDHFRKKDTAMEFLESTIDNIPGWDKSQLLVY